MTGQRADGNDGEALVGELLAAVPPERRSQVERVVGLAERLAALVDEARTSWPSVGLRPEAFVRHVAERLPGEADVEASLRALHASDLYLAFACASGDRRALASFDRVFLSQVRSYVAKLDSSASFADEVKQQLREKLLVPAQGRPRILDYTGRGPLGGWLRVAAIRTGRNLLRSAKGAPVASDDVDQIRTAKPDPELGYLKQRYARELRDAFEATLARLGPRERNVLRLYFLEAMSSNAIATMYDVSGATVRLWIKQWREAILDETRKRLAARLRMDSRELDSVMGLVQSQLDLTVSRLLR